MFLGNGPTEQKISPLWGKEAENAPNERKSPGKLPEKKFL